MATGWAIAVSHIKFMAFIVQDGCLQHARFCASPNCDARPDATVIDLLVIHSISLPPASYGGPEIEHFFCNRLDATADPYFPEICELKVSAHLLIRRDGEILQFVNFDQRAWHAGESEFKGRRSCNDFSIGIELEGCDNDKFRPAQYDSLVEATVALQRSYLAISSDRITGHEHIAPGRKTDPGPGFDWLHYRSALAGAQSAREQAGPRHPPPIAQDTP